MAGIEACRCSGLPGQDQRGRGEGRQRRRHRAAGAIRARTGIEVRYIEFMPLDAQDIWDRSRVLLADDMIEMLVARDRPARSRAGPGSARPRDRVPVRGRHRTRGLYRLGQPAVLPELQSHPAHRRRQSFATAFSRSTRPISNQFFATAAPTKNLIGAIRENIAAKWLGHEINQSQFVPPPRPMYAIGG